VRQDVPPPVVVRLSLPPGVGAEAPQVPVGPAGKSVARRRGPCETARTGDVPVRAENRIAAWGAVSPAVARDRPCRTGLRRSG